MTTSFAFAATALLSLCLQAKENPEFTYGSAHKPGSWVTLKMEMDASGVKMMVQTTRTLVEVGADRRLMGEEVTLPAC